MGRTGLGVGLFAPEETSAEWLAKEGLRRTADNCFYVGLVLTALAPTRELYPPAFVDGALVRLVTDAKVVWVEQWDRDAQAWIVGGPMVDEVMKGPTASPETLRKFRHPTEVLE